MPLGMEVGFGPGHIILDWDPAPPKKGQSPQFSAHVCCGHTAAWIKMPLAAKVGFCPGHFVLHGIQLSPHKGRRPQFSAYVYCGQTVAHLSFCWNGRPLYTCYMGQKCTYFCQKPTEVVDWQVDHVYSSQSVDWHWFSGLSQSMVRQVSWSYAQRLTPGTSHQWC